MLMTFMLGINIIVAETNMAMTSFTILKIVLIDVTICMIIQIVGL